MEIFTTAEETCQEVLQVLRSSSLIFLLQESPYSAYITIRKRFRKETKLPVVSSFARYSKEKTLTDLKLSHDYEDLKNKLEETLFECEELHTRVSDKDKIIETLHSKLSEAEAEIKEKRNLAIRNEKLAAENKASRNENEDLMKEKNAANVALKASRKDLKDTTHRYNKKLEELENKVEELTKFKMLKNAEEKEIKNKEKITDKKLKIIQEKEAKLKVDLLSLERHQKKKEISDDNHNLVASEIESDCPGLTSMDQFSCTLDSTNMDQVSSTLDSTNMDQVPFTLDSTIMDQFSCTLDPTNMDLVSCTFDSPNMDQVSCTLDPSNMDQVFCTSDPSKVCPTSSDYDDQDEKTDLFRLLEAFSEQTLKKLDDFGQNFVNSWSTLYFNLAYHSQF